MLVTKRHAATLALAIAVLVCASGCGESTSKRSVKDLIPGLKSKDPAERVKACNELFQYRVGAKEAMPDLIALFKDEDVKVRPLAIACVGVMGLEAVPELRKCFDDPDPQVRAGAGAALQLVMDKPLDLIPLLIKALKDADSEVRFQAAGTVVQFGRGATKPHLDFFLEVIKNDDNKRVRCILIQALGSWGKDAEKAMPLFQELRKHSDPQISTAADRAIVDIEGKEDLANPASGSEADFKPRVPVRPPPPRPQ